MLVTDALSRGIIFHSCIGGNKDYCLMHAIRYAMRLSLPSSRIFYYIAYWPMPPPWSDLLDCSRLFLPPWRTPLHVSVPRCASRSALSKWEGDEWQAPGILHDTSITIFRFAGLRQSTWWGKFGILWIHWHPTSSSEWFLSSSAMFAWLLSSLTSTLSSLLSSKQAWMGGTHKTWGQRRC